MRKRKEILYIDTLNMLLKTMYKAKKKYPDEDSYQSAMFDHTLRWFTFRIPAAYISEEADKLSKKLGIDLRNSTWVDQRKIDPDKLFILDHMHTMKGCIGEQFFTSKCKKKDILNAIEQAKITAWITRKENTALNRNGFKSNRPNGPEEAYKQCGIKLLKINSK